VFQDALYLREYALALSLVGVRSPDEDALVMFDEHYHRREELARGLPQRSRRRSGRRGTDTAGPDHPRLHQLPAEDGPFGRLSRSLGAVLPCYSIYWEVGKALLEEGSPNPLYQKWIDICGGEEFGTLVEAVLDLADNVYEVLNTAQKARVTAAFVTISRYEWMFWDAAWRLEG
jgi:thiaminase/transcriptional activator TenA